MDKEQENKLIGVVYKIVNSANGKLYIGSSARYSKRRKRHLEDLRTGNHHSKKLQRAFNKYGESNFSIEVIEEFEYSDKAEILSREQHYLSLLQPQYNICLIAGSQLGTKRTQEFKRKCSSRLLGKPTWNKGLKTGPQSEETKMRRARSLTGSKRNSDTKKLMSEMAKGRKFTQEHKDKLAKAKYKHGKYSRWQPDNSPLHGKIN